MTFSEPLATYLFTSESVGEGHPDKICDQIADAILDLCLEGDPASKVAVEVAIRPNLVIVFGVVHTRAVFNTAQVVRKVLKDIGYDSATQEVDHQTCTVIDYIELYNRFEPTDLVQKHAYKEAAGDQGLVFGYASNETPQSLPCTIDLAHKISRKMKSARLDGTLPWLLPDTKTQVTMEYKDDGGRAVPLRLHTVVLTAQHTQDVTVEELRKKILMEVIRKVVPSKYMDGQTLFHIQPSGDAGVTPSGKFAGVTGRKIVVDTYGGWGAHGGGAFSGKDYRQVDRSGAYMARWIAKSIVQGGLADRCLVQLSYSIGVAEPVSIFVTTYNTGIIRDENLRQVIVDNFDMRPAAIADTLGLTKPIYYQSSKNGHFTNEDFPWERAKPLLLRRFSKGDLS